MSWRPMTKINISVHIRLDQDVFKTQCDYEDEMLLQDVFTKNNVHWVCRSVQLDFDYFGFF